MSGDTRPVIVTERGWPMHFVGAAACTFRRNTLLRCGENAVVVSSVGNYRPPSLNGDSCEIGVRAFYETLALRVHRDGPYLEGDPDQRIEFESPGILGLDPAVDTYADMAANIMHDRVVEEVSARLLAGELVSPIAGAASGTTELQACT
ncbi:MAG: hypothetical protein EPN36_03590 [Rhodanobacteraceae bacterium]|nr:MAG: hypothetical protein EPN36_03590 [Rhodanobacteraceae bacterium]